MTLLTVVFQLGRLFLGRDDMYFCFTFSTFMLDIKTIQILYSTHEERTNAMSNSILYNEKLKKQNNVTRLPLQKTNLLIW